MAIIYLWGERLDKNVMINQSCYEPSMASAVAFSLSRVTKFKKEFFELQNDQNFVSLRLFRDHVEYILTNYPTVSLRQIELFLNKGLESIRYQKKSNSEGNH